MELYSYSSIVLDDVSIKYGDNVYLTNLYQVSDINEQDWILYKIITIRPNIEIDFPWFFLGDLGNTEHQRISLRTAEVENTSQSVQPSNITVFSLTFQYRKMKKCSDKEQSNTKILLKSPRSVFIIGVKDNSSENFLQTCF